MIDETIRKQLTCSSCGVIERCGYAKMLYRLQAVGVLRRSQDPEPALVNELFASSADGFACGSCEHVGLQVTEARDDDSEDWGDVVVCKGCRKPIPPERLEIFPGSTLCAVCQQKDDSGANDEPEYCPRCGDIMSVKLKSGTSRYVMSCPGCGSR